MADDTKKDKGRIWPWLIGGLAILAAGAGAFWYLSQSPEAEARPAPPPPLIETAKAEAVDRVILRQTAFVRPVSEVPVLPETTARISKVAPEFDRGRRVAQGTLLVALDRTALEAGVARAEAAVAEAEVAVAEARIEADRQDTLQERGVAADAVLQQALVALASAEARLETSRVERRLARDSLRDGDITAPFDAIVLEVSADPGELVTPATVLGRLASATEVELEVGLLPRDLAVLPNGTAGLPGARVILRETAQGPALAEGVVASVEAGLASGSRLLPLVVRVADPFDGPRPLRLNELLTAELSIDIAADNTLAVPGRAFKPGGTVWIVRDGGLIRTAPELILREETAAGDRVILRADTLKAGDEVMLTDLPAASEGQAVRLQDATERGSE